MSDTPTQREALSREERNHLVDKIRHNLLSVKLEGHSGSMIDHMVFLVKELDLREQEHEEEEDRLEGEISKLLAQLDRQAEEIRKAWQEGADAYAKACLDHMPTILPLRLVPHNPHRAPSTPPDQHL